MRIASHLAVKLVFATLLSGASAFAESRLLGMTPLQEGRFGEQIEIKLIEIDVIVTDRAGKRVTGLTADDFEIREGRTPQQITNFTEYAREPAEESSGGTRPQPAPAQTGTVLVLMDMIPRDGLARSTTFEHLERVVSTLLDDGNRVGIVLWEPGLQRSTSIVEPTSDADAVRRAVRKLAVAQRAERSSTASEEDAAAVDDFFAQAAAAAGSRGARIDVAGQRTSTDNFAGELGLMKFRRKTAAMRRLVISVGAQPGKKSLLYVSNDFAMPEQPGARSAALELVEELARSANAAGVTFYAARPYVPDPSEGGEASLQRQLDALRRVTGPTGGTLDFGLPSMATVGEGVAEDLESYYSIAYRARSDGRDRERRIVVRAKNRDYRIRARTSFVEKSDETVARDTLLTRLFSEEGGGDIEFTLAAGQPRRTGKDRWLLPLSLRIPASQLQFAPERSESVAQITILIAAGNGVAEVTKVTEDKLRVVEGTHAADGFVKYSVQMLGDQRGSVVSIGVFDRRSGLVGVQTIDTRQR